MFSLLSAHFHLLLISLISLTATQSFADDLFTDWAPSDLTDASISDSNSQFLSSDTNTDQLLAFNDDPSSNIFTSDSPTINSFGQTSTTNPPLDTSNMFLDSTPLDALDTTGFTPSDSDEQALPDLPNDPLGADATSPDLLANGATGDCSSFRPSSSSKKSRKREETTCTAEELHDAGAGFFGKSDAEKAEQFKKIVCPSDHFGAAVSIPVCSSSNPLLTQRVPLNAPHYPDSDTLLGSKLRTLSPVSLLCLSATNRFISTLVLWNEATKCMGTRKPYCCQEWIPDVYTDALNPQLVVSFSDRLQTVWR